MATAGNTSVSGSFVEIKLAFVLTILLLAVLVQGSPIMENRSRIDNGVAIYDNSLGIEGSKSRKVSSHVGEELLGPVKQPKRLSDQRRAELETLMALSKMTGKLVNVSRGGKQTDAAKSGRRKRSVLDSLKNLNFLFQLSGSLSQKGNRAFPVAG